jgi:hypothetical protein
MFTTEVEAAIETGWFSGVSNEFAIGGFVEFENICFDGEIFKVVEVNSVTLLVISCELGNVEFVI